MQPINHIHTNAQQTTSKTQQTKKDIGKHQANHQQHIKQQPPSSLEQNKIKDYIDKVKIGAEEDVFGWNHSV
jgi:hypothetical protein